MVAVKLALLSPLHFCGTVHNMLTSTSSKL